MHQHVEIKLTLNLWMPATHDKKAIKSLVQKGINKGLGRYTKPMLDPIVVSRVREEAQIYGIKK